MPVLYWILDNLLYIAFLCTATSALYSALRVRSLDHTLRDHALQLGALREQANLSDCDVDRYHERVHPHCAELGGR